VGGRGRQWDGRGGERDSGGGLGWPGMRLLLLSSSRLVSAQWRDDGWGAGVLFINRLVNYHYCSQPASELYCCQ
jgi:hypothetical protein